MDEKEQARAELLARRAKFIALLDSYQPDNIALCEALMRGDKDLKDTFKRVFHPLLSALEPSLGGGLSLMHKIRASLDGETYFGSRRAVWDFLTRFYQYYVEQGRVEAVLPLILKAHHKDSFEKIASGPLLQDIFARPELRKLHIKKIELAEQPLRPDIPPDPRHLQNLEELTIHASPDWVDYLPWAAMKQLKKLRIAGCQLRDLPQGLAELSKLETIEIFDNQFDTIPNVLAKCPALYTIVIHKNQIEKLPDWIFTHKKMWHLNLSHNPLRQLDPRIWSMPKLDWLEVAYTNLQTLGAIKPNKNITWLDISGNNLGELPADMAKLPMLKTLHAEHCGIEHLPDFIGDFSELKSLYLSGNQFDALPDKMLKLSKLESLSLCDMKINRYPDMSKMRIHFATKSPELYTPQELAAFKKAFPRNCYI